MQKCEKKCVWGHLQTVSSLHSLSILSWSKRNLSFTYKKWLLEKYMNIGRYIVGLNEKKLGSILHSWFVNDD